VSLLNGFTDFLYGPGYSHTDFLVGGANYTWGGDLEQTPNGAVGGRGAGGYTRIQAPLNGGVYQTHHQHGSPHTKYIPSTGKPVITASAGVGIGTSMLFTGAGFYYGGIAGGVAGMAQDVAVGGALSRYGHSMANVNGTQALVYGNMGRFQSTYEAVRNSGKLGLRAAQVAGVASYANRGIWAVAGASIASGLAGGGMLGMAAAAPGAALGARFSPYLTAGAMITGGAYLAGRAGQSVLRQGYDYRQSQKSIHTSGDLMAFNTNAALTMRQRALSALQNSQMNSRSMLGQEAGLLSNPNRSYSSPFRAGY
jgi:hypothetical protein